MDSGWFFSQADVLEARREELLSNRPNLPDANSVPSSWGEFELSRSRLVDWHEGAWERMKQDVHSSEDTSA